MLGLRAAKGYDRLRSRQITVRGQDYGISVSALGNLCRDVPETKRPWDIVGRHAIGRIAATQGPTLGRMSISVSGFIEETNTGAQKPPFPFGRGVEWNGDSGGSMHRSIVHHLNGY